MGVGNGRSVADLHEDISGNTMVRTIEIIDMADRGTDGLDTKITAAQNGRDGELAGVARVAEAILETADGHVGEFANGVIDDFVSGSVEFELGHSQEMT